MTWGEVLRHNLWQFVVWLDQGLGGLVSTLLKEKAFADLTLSANAWRWHVEGTRRWPRRLIDALFWWQDAHCYESYVYEVQRRHLPDSMR